VANLLRLETPGWSVGGAAGPEPAPEEIKLGKSTVQGDREDWELEGVGPTLKQCACVRI
jgi:hypothetical protein